MNEQHEAQQPAAEHCGPGCGCGSTGGSARMKWLICGVVALAAVATVAAHVSRSHATEIPKQDYATALPAIAAVESETPSVAVENGTWGAPISTLAELNLVATNTEAVFVVIPSSDATRTSRIQQEVTTAAATITARGTKMGTFLLSQDSRDYAGLVAQVGAPAVLAASKGLGMAAVPDAQITQENLMKAFVGASRPSSCGPSACGPSSAGCK
ncbi:MAG: hypothetical protein K8T26_10820 [Lentisphaerae bacterium]|nr:hypothetical protein [Lentisphaerota bacterium]